MNILMPYFLIKNELLCNYPSVAEDLNADIVIIGGGFTGVLMAYQCILDGYNAILIDNNHIGLSPTAFSSGFLFSEIDIFMKDLSKQIGLKNTSLIYHECLNAINNLKQIINDNNIDCDLQIKDALNFAAFKKDAKILHDEYSIRLKNGIPVQWLNTNELSAMYGLHNTYGGILTPQNISFDPLKFITKLLSICEGKGLRVYDHTKISKIKTAARTVTLTTDRKNIIKAKKIIYCNSHHNLPESVLVKTKIVQSEIVVTESLKINDMLYVRDLFLKNIDNYNFFLGINSSNRILSGIADSQMNNDVNLLGVLDKKFKLHLPNLYTQIDFKWQASYLNTGDQLPLIGAYQNVQSAYYVVPVGTNGYIYSIMAMKMLHDFMRNRANVFNDLFNINRFETDF